MINFLNIFLYLVVLCIPIYNVLIALNVLSILIPVPPRSILIKSVPMTARNALRMRWILQPHRMEYHHFSNPKVRKYKWHHTFQWKIMTYLPSQYKPIHLTPVFKTLVVYIYIHIFSFYYCLLFTYFILKIGLENITVINNRRKRSTKPRKIEMI